MPSVQGRVIEQFTNRGIAGAFVSIGGISTITDGSGYFLVRNLPEGTIGVDASAPNHQPSSGTVQAFGNQTASIQLVLTPMARAF